jgi:hypothetical protein
MSSSRESVGCDARCAGDGEPQGGIEAQCVGVVLIAPTLSEQHQHGAQQVGQGMADEVRLPWVV